MHATKRHFSSILKQHSIYHRLRVSSVYDLYLALMKNQVIKARDRELDFYRTTLDGFKPGDMIFDIGANVGDKVDVFLKMGARVVAVDPDERNQEILRDRFHRYRMTPKPVTIVGKAVGKRVGNEAMWVYGPGSVFNSLSEKSPGILDETKKRSGHLLDAYAFKGKRIVGTTTLDQLIDTYGLPSFVKIDVVGYELEVLQGLHCPVPCLSFEIEFAELRQESMRCIEILGGLSSRGQFNYTCDRRNGLVLNQWLDFQPFRRLVNGLDGCSEGCMEVFWKTPI